MSRRPARFTQAEVARLMRVAEGLGKTVQAVDGKLIIVPVDAPGLTLATEGEELDAELLEWRKKRGYG